MLILMSVFHNIQRTISVPGGTGIGTPGWHWQEYYWLQVALALALVSLSGTENMAWGPPRSSPAVDLLTMPPLCNLSSHCYAPIAQLRYEYRENAYICCWRTTYIFNWCWDLVVPAFVILIPTLQHRGSSGRRGKSSECHQNVFEIVFVFEFVCLFAFVFVEESMARACGVSSPSERLHCATYHTGLQPFCSLHTLSHIPHFTTHSKLHISHFTLHTAQGHCRVFSFTSSHSTDTAAHILFACFCAFVSRIDCWLLERHGGRCSLWIPSVVQPHHC